MATLRIHLDDVPADSAPLLIAPGSHRLGLVPEREIDAAVARHGTYACLAQRGDVWAYATPILHASAASTGAHRRVLQVDFAARPLDAPLAWLGPLSRCPTTRVRCYSRDLRHAMPCHLAVTLRAADPGSSLGKGSFKTRFCGTFSDNPAGLWCLDDPRRRFETSFPRHGIR